MKTAVIILLAVLDFAVWLEVTLAVMRLAAK
jgi:hypothetical protein